MMSKKTLFLATFAIAMSSIAAGGPPTLTRAGLPKVTIGRTPTHVFENTVYLSGKRAPGDYKVFAALKVDTVIDLSGTADRAAIEEAGLEYVHIPLEKSFPLTLHALTPVMESIETATRARRVLVCDDDGEETGAVWALHRVLTDGVDINTALDEGRSIGLTERRLIERVRNLMTNP
jgi:hypothetical protein